MIAQAEYTRSHPFLLDGTWDKGTDEQEDELDDVHKGVLDAPTDDEGPGETFIKPNRQQIDSERADEEGLPEQPVQ